MRRLALLSTVVLLPACGGSQKAAPAGSPASQPAAAAAAPAGQPAAAPQPASAPEPAYMARPPELPPVRPFTPAAPATWTLPNGLTVVFVEKRSAPLVTLELAVRTGANGDPAGKSGLATLTADALDEGAGSRGALALAEELERLGAELSTAASLEGSFVSLTVLRSKLDEATPLFADVVLRPRFDPKDVARVRGEQLGRIAQRKVEPRALASLALGAALYGDTAYGRPTTGYAGTVGTLTPADVRRHYERVYRPGNAVLVVVGDLGAADARTLVEGALGGWKAGAPVAALPAPAPVAHPPRLVVVDKPGAPQTVMRVALAAIPRADPRYPALQAVTAILGGSFTSRLERNLRERNNFSYGGGAMVQPTRGRGPFVAFSDVFTQTTGPAVAETLRELEAIHALSDEEVGKALSLLRQQIVQQTQSGRGLATTLASLLVAGAGLEEYQRLDAELAALDRARLEEVAKALLGPGQATVVLVGDLAKIRPAVEALGLGKPELRDTEGKRR